MFSKKEFKRNLNNTTGRQNKMTGKNAEIVLAQEKHSMKLNGLCRDRQDSNHKERHKLISN